MTLSIQRLGLELSPDFLDCEGREMIAILQWTFTENLRDV